MKEKLYLQYLVGAYSKYALTGISVLPVISCKENFCNTHLFLMSNCIVKVLRQDIRAILELPLLPGFATFRLLKIPTLNPLRLKNEQTNSQPNKFLLKQA